MPVKRCGKCGNTEFYPNGQCCYCTWRGTVGPGEVLKRAVSIHNAKINTKPKKKK